MPVPSVGKGHLAQALLLWSSHSLLAARMYGYSPVQVEEHLVDGEMKRLLVHRKGSTRAFPPHHPLIPVDYQMTGQPVLIGGTMGTNSYVLTGQPASSGLWARPLHAPKCACCWPTSQGNALSQATWRLVCELEVLLMVVPESRL